MGFWSHRGCTADWELMKKLCPKYSNAKGVERDGCGMIPARTAAALTLLVDA